jgi:D-arabinose 1-dehydrogenase-like Zn-dependent alcohol dehydrogenase
MARAALVNTFNGPVEVLDIPEPELEPTAMLAEVEAATLCGTDVHFWQGMMRSQALPYIPGHETAGRIVQISGERYDILGQQLKPGDRVLMAYPWCGHCYYCTVANEPTLCPNAGRFGRQQVDAYPHLLGGCAEMHYVPTASDVIRIPDNVSSPLAASAACALRTVMHGFELLGPIAPHETVVIQGSGPIGLYALAVARDRGANTVHVVGAPASRLEIARSFGADDILNIEDMRDVADRQKWVLDRTGNRGADIVVQCATGAAIPEGLDFTRSGGRFLSIGAGGLPDKPYSIGTKTYIGFRAGEARHYLSALTFLSTKTGIAFERVLSREFPLSRVHEALQGMADGTEVKPVVLPGLK